MTKWKYADDVLLSAIFNTFHNKLQTASIEGISPATGL